MFLSNKKHRQPVTMGLMIPILYIDRFWLLAIQRFSNLEQSVILCIFLFKCRSTNFMSFFWLTYWLIVFPQMKFWIANVGAFRNFFFLMTVISHLTRTKGNFSFRSSDTQIKQDTTLFCFSSRIHKNIAKLDRGLLKMCALSKHNPLLMIITKI